LQPGNSIFDGTPASQQEDTTGKMLFPQAPQQFETVNARQANVDYN
jgi:hypothetical protein